jgi:hypothetical protein
MYLRMPAIYVSKLGRKNRIRESLASLKDKAVEPVERYCFPVCAEVLYQSGPVEFTYSILR